MRHMLRAFSLMLFLALAAVPAFAQEAEEAVESSPQGLGLGMVLIGLIAVFAIGYYMAQRESNGDEDDLV